jgi:hypothetical protein
MVAREVVATTSALLATLALAVIAPPPASALDFSFSFDGVQGIIYGLSEGTSLPAEVILTSFPDSPPEPAYANYIFYSLCNAYAPSLVGPGSSPLPDCDDPPGYNGFTVVNGRITATDWYGESETPLGWNYRQFLNLTASGAVLEIVELMEPGYVVRRSTSGVARFRNLSERPSVPGPLPALGAAASFCYSRKLRNRIKASRRTVARID